MRQYPYQYPCKYLGNYDGDTITLELDRGFGDYKKVGARLGGLDTPEVRKARGVPPSEVKLFKAAGLLAKRKAATFLMKDECTYQFLSGEIDKYGRPVGDIVRSDGASLCEHLLFYKLAVPYEGGNRSGQAFLDLHRANFKWLFENNELTEEY